MEPGSGQFRIAIGLVPCLVRPGSESREKVDKKFCFSVSEYKLAWFRAWFGLVPCLVRPGSILVLEYKLAWFRAWFGLVAKVEKSRQKVLFSSFRSQTVPGSVPGSAWFRAWFGLVPSWF